MKSGSREFLIKYFWRAKKRYSFNVKTEPTNFSFNFRKTALCISHTPANAEPPLMVSKFIRRSRPRPAVILKYVLLRPLIVIRIPGLRRLHTLFHRNAKTLAICLILKITRAPREPFYYLQIKWFYDALINHTVFKQHEYNAYSKGTDGAAMKVIKQ